MIHCIFTIDYEIYGNGEGSLRELIYEPAEKLKTVFEKWNASFVAFVEAAELEMIETHGTDQAIELVKHQLRAFYKSGIELGLHIHPQWYNARYENGKWEMDYDEYNLCTLPRERILQIVKRSIEYLRSLLGVADFRPISFRAGNWLFQPTGTLAKVLNEQGVKFDSSVFKGGLQHEYNMDYRPATKNGYYWPFGKDVNVFDPKGDLIELPIYAKMVPLWKFLTGKRMSLQRKGPIRPKTAEARFLRLFDYMRLWHPLKLDFCRMTIKELTKLLDKEICEDQKNPNLLRTIIGIGHTKDLIDIETVDSLLSFLIRKGVQVSIFQDLFREIQVLGECANK